MHRIDGPGATAENRFTDGDPVAGTPATMVTDDFMNDVQEEIMSVLTDRGIAPVKGVQNQLLTAIKALVANIAQATELIRGAAKIATQALTNAGTDDTTIVTPKKLSVWFSTVVGQATELVSGFAKIATQTQTNSGTDDTTIVTPKKLRFGFSMSFGVNSYIVAPSWLGSWIVQFGFASPGIVSGGTITYPIPFTTGAKAGHLTHQYTSSITNTISFKQAAIGSDALKESMSSFNWITDNTIRSLSFSWIVWGS